MVLDSFLNYTTNSKLQTTMTPDGLIHSPRENFFEKCFATFNEKRLGVMGSFV